MAKLEKSRLNQLYKAIAFSMKQLKPFRKQRLAMLELYTGGNYGTNDEKIPLNLTELTVNIFLQQLANQPNVLATTKYAQLKSRARKLEMGINHLIDEISLADTLEMATLEAMLSVGFVKIAVEASTQVELNGYLHDIGMPFCDSVGLDDWCHDMTAKRWDKGQFFMDRYPVPYELAMDSSLFKKKDLIKKPSTDQKEDRDSNLSQGKQFSEDNEFNQIIELWDIFIPNENLILTVQDTGSGHDEFSGEVLREFDWAGPEYGPYRQLSFNRVPNNIMPLPPAALWKDMAELANELYKKLARQANRQKTVVGVRKSGEADGDRVLNSYDGKMIALDDPKNVQEYSFGGIKNETMAFLVYTRDQFSYMQGNLDALGGLSPQADTLGQDQMLSSSASARIQKMRQRIEDFTTDVTSDLGLYLWTDPAYRIPLVIKTGIEGMDINMEWGPEDREGDYYDYNVQVEPFSMMRKSPEERLAFIDRYLAQTLGPLYPMMQQQGVVVNVEAVNKIYSKYSRMPELEEILTFANPQIEPEQPVQTPGKAPVTTRNYVRHNRPGATRQGKDQVLVNTLMGGNNQPAEQAALVRPTG